MQSKLPHVGTTIFTTMSKMALDYGAINLAQGFPNFPVDEKLQELLEKNARLNVHQYAPMAGNVQLLTKLQALTEKVYNRRVLPTEILVTAGATQAIFTTIQALVFPGDEVVLIDPAYDCYGPAVDLCQAKRVHVSMEEDFSIDWNKVEAVFTSKTKLIILNNPHNPSGSILNQEDIEALRKIVAKFPNVLLLSDEVYEYIAFGQTHASINRYPDLAERSVIVSSFGKTFHITGWKIGYVIAPEKIMHELKKVHQFLVFCVNSVAQETLSAYLDYVDVRELSSFYEQKRDFFRSLLSNSRFELLPSNGSYFQVVSYSKISNESDVQFCERMVKEFGVAAIPMSVFYESKLDRKHIRLCYAKDDQTLIQASEKLCKI